MSLIWNLIGVFLLVLTVSRRWTTLFFYLGIVVCNRMELRGKRNCPKEIAIFWSNEKKDPPGFEIRHFKNKGRGIVTLIKRYKGEFLLEYAGKLISEEEGDRREKKKSSGYRYFFKNLCIDATEETQRLGRLVNHGDNKRTRNASMKLIGKDRLCLFASRDIDVEEEILYDYGISSLPWTKQLDQARKGGEEPKEGPAQQRVVRSGENTIEMSDNLEAADQEERSEDKKDKKREKDLDKHIHVVDGDEIEKLDEQMFGSNVKQGDKEEFGSGLQQEELVANENNSEKLETNDKAEKKKKKRDENETKVDEGKQMLNDQEQIDEFEYDNERIDTRHENQDPEEASDMDPPDDLKLDKKNAGVTNKKQDEPSEEPSKGDTEDEGNNSDQGQTEEEEKPLKLDNARQTGQQAKKQDPIQKPDVRSEESCIELLDNSGGIIHNMETADKKERSDEEVQEKEEELDKEIKEAIGDDMEMLDEDTCVWGTRNSAEKVEEQEDKEEFGLDTLEGMEKDNKAGKRKNENQTEEDKRKKKSKVQKNIDEVEYYDENLDPNHVNKDPYNIGLDYLKQYAGKAGVTMEKKEQGVLSAEPIGVDTEMPDNKEYNTDPEQTAEEAETLQMIRNQLLV